MSCNNNNYNNSRGLKVLIGVAIGTAVGAAIAYLSNEERRNRFIDNVNDTADRVKGDVRDAYYEGRIRARRTGRDLSRYIDGMKGDARDLYDNVCDSASRMGRKAKDTLEDIADLTEEELRSLKEEARREANDLANNN